MQSLDIRETGPGPIISHMCKQLEVRETINDVVSWDEKQCLLDPGTHVEALIINILCQRDPLYRVKNFYLEQDVELLFGKGVKADYFNDDALGSTTCFIPTSPPLLIYVIGKNVKNYHLSKAKEFIKKHKSLGRHIIVSRKFERSLLSLRDLNNVQFLFWDLAPEIIVNLAKDMD